MEVRAHRLPGQGRPERLDVQAEGGPLAEPLLQPPPQSRLPDLLVQPGALRLLPGALLAPGFQILRANGDHWDTASYLAQGLPTISSWSIDDVVATQSGPVLTVYWLITSTQVVDGVAQPAFKASGDITSMSQADGYIEIPADQSVVEEGTLLNVTLF